MWCIWTLSSRPNWRTCILLYQQFSDVHFKNVCIQKCNTKRAKYSIETTKWYITFSFGHSVFGALLKISEQRFIHKSQHIKFSKPVLVRSGCYLNLVCLSHGRWGSRRVCLEAGSTLIEMSHQEMPERFCPLSVWSWGCPHPLCSVHVGDPYPDTHNLFLNMWPTYIQRCALNHIFTFKCVQCCIWLVRNIAFVSVRF